MKRYLITLSLNVALLAGASLSVEASESTNDQWTVAWKGFTEFTKTDRDRKPFFKVNFAANELAKYMGKVLDTKINVVPWKKAEGSNIIYITEEKYLPKEIQNELKGKAKDTILIKYPYEIEGKKVCLIASRDHYAHDFAVYYFLTKYMNVHWVGPGKLGEVYKVNKEWKIPAEINILNESKLEHRFWYMGSFTGRKWLAASNRTRSHHALGEIFNPKKYAKTTPEVYPMGANGKRFIPKKLHGWQPCTTNPRSIEIATQAVLKFFKTHPARSAASLSVNDGAGNNCMCKNCLALDEPDAFAAGRRPYLSDRFFTFYNTVMENVLKEKPDAHIAVLSYGVTSRPPVRVKINPKIIVFQVVPTVRKMVKWAKTGAGMGMHYWTYDGGYLQMRPKMKVIKELVQIMSDTPGGGFYSENIAFWPSCAPNFYTMSKILWNPDKTDVAATYQEFYDLAYGKRAGKYIGEFYRRWEEMYYRQSKAYQYNPIYTWRRYSQFNTFRRYDFDFMDKMMARAEKAAMSKKERKRFGYLKTYYQWLRGNAELVLITKELKDEDFLAENKYDAIMAKLSDATKLISEFKEIYVEKIFADNTGWLIDKNRKLKTSINTYDLFISQVRNLTVSNFDAAVGSYMDVLAKEKEKAFGKKRAVSFFKKSAKRYPQLKGYFTAVVNQLEGKVSPNIVTSGDFENAEMVDGRLKIPGWLTYQDYGMMKGTHNKYYCKGGYKSKNAVGMGTGDYAELRTELKMEKGARYKLSIWYKTENTKKQLNLWIFHYKGEIEDLMNIDYKNKLSRFLMWKMPSTAGEWSNFTTTFVTTKGGNFIMQPAGKRLTLEEKIWFDNLEIRKLD